MRRSVPKNPGPAAIRQSVPLSQHPRRPSDPLSACNLCGLPPGDQAEMQVFREHDEADRPIRGDAALVFVARDHGRCRRAVSAHPRLYARETGQPGHFPQLCWSCAKRDGFACRDPRLKANGGGGLVVQLAGGLPPGTIICPRPKIVHDAVECEGWDAEVG